MTSDWKECTVQDLINNNLAPAKIIKADFQNRRLEAA